MIKISSYTLPGADPAEEDYPLSDPDSEDSDEYPAYYEDDTLYDAALNAFAPGFTAAESSSRLRRFCRSCVCARSEACDFLCARCGGDRERAFCERCACSLNRRCRRECDKCDRDVGGIRFCSR